LAFVKTTSYIDAVNTVARNAMHADLSAAVAPLIEITTNLHRISMQLAQSVDDLRERVTELEHANHDDQIERHTQHIADLTLRIETLEQGGGGTPKLSG
jgi:hypothetical protein